MRFLKKHHMKTYIITTFVCYTKDTYVFLNDISTDFFKGTLT